jgi:hypothetical protein
MRDRSNLASVRYHAPITVAIAVNARDQALTTYDLTADHIETMQTLFRQLTYSLTILSSAAELTLQPDNDPMSSPNLRLWLQPSARQAEDVLQRMRDLNLPTSTLITDLTQSLTVLVLAADMIAQGHLTDSVLPDSYSLMRRNAERAMTCLLELRSQFGE